MSRRTKDGTSPTTMLSGAVANPAPTISRPTGGRDLRPPALINRREPITADLAITISTLWRNHRPIYRVAVVDFRNRPIRPTEEYPTPLRARNAANRLYAQLTEEN